jgi:hypothetical protein
MQKDDMDWNFIITVSTLVVDIGILAILILEFNYDKVQDEKRHYQKRKKKPQFDQLTIGESR